MRGCWYAGLALVWSVPAMSEAMLLTLPGTPAPAPIELASVEWRGDTSTIVPRSGVTAALPRSGTFAPVQGSGEIAVPGSAIGRNSAVAPGVRRGEPIDSLYFKHKVETAREAGSGQAEGKRAVSPPAVGQLIATLTQPWAACLSGARFDGVRLTEGVQKYRLDGVQILRCADLQVVFHYAGLTAE